MKGKMFEVVAYIARRYGSDGRSAGDPQEVRDELFGAGFEEDDVERALAWLDRLRRAGVSPVQAPGPRRSVRPPSADEARKLSTEARGFLLRLERAGILDHALREAVYERALKLDEPELGVEEIRVLVALVLETTPGHDSALVAAVLAGDLTPIYH
jgi:Smg protein